MISTAKPLQVWVVEVEWTMAESSRIQDIADTGATQSVRRSDVNYLSVFVNSVSAIVGQPI
jgi:hypothetical protein